MKESIRFLYRLRWGLLVVLLGAMGAKIWVRFADESRKSARTLPVLGTVPDFSLVERSGQPVALSDLKGYTWIADFIFTHCPGPCPLMTSRMGELQKALSDARDVRLVSFTVDPARDSPQVLSQYADRFGARKERWLFLTGTKEAIYRLAGEGFRLTAAENPPGNSLPGEGPILHSTRFVLVDSKARIRGYYDGTEAELVQRILPDVEALRREG